MTLKLLFTAIIFSLSLAGYSQETYSTSVKQYSDSTGKYEIKYEYRSDICAVPATDPPQPCHYDATITVYKLSYSKGKISKKEQVGTPFRGVYVDAGCWDAEPADHVRKAKQLSLIN